MPDALRQPVILEAGRELPAEAELAVGGRQQHRAAIRGNRAAVERAHKFTPAARSKAQLIWFTLCPHRGSLLGQIKWLSQNNFI